jgi:hypothetical protein
MLLRIDSMFASSMLWIATQVSTAPGPWVGGGLRHKQCTKGAQFSQPGSLLLAYVYCLRTCSQLGAFTRPGRIRIVQERQRWPQLRSPAYADVAATDSSSTLPALVT